VNPWRFQSWMGHKRIDETMIYVHVAENHRRDLPPAVIEASLGEADPDRRVLKMLGARADLRGTNLAKTEAGRDEGSVILVS
jgi:hypothetical protein